MDVLSLVSNYCISCGVFSRVFFIMHTKSASKWIRKKGESYTGDGCVSVCFCVCVCLCLCVCDVGSAWEGKVTLSVEINKEMK